MGNDALGDASGDGALDDSGNGIHRPHNLGLKLGRDVKFDFVAGAASSTKNNTSFSLIVSSISQLLGISLTTLIDEPVSPVKALLAYQGLFGFGVGLCFGAVSIATSLHVSSENLATGHGAVSQARLFGGCLGIAICTVVINYRSNQDLAATLTGEQLRDLHYDPSKLHTLPAELHEQVRIAYSKAFAVDVKVMVCVCAVMVIVSIFTLERVPAAMSALKNHQQIQAVSNYIGGGSPKGGVDNLCAPRGWRWKDRTMPSREKSEVV